MNWKSSSSSSLSFCERGLFRLGRSLSVSDHDFGLGRSLSVSAHAICTSLASVSSPELNQSSSSASSERVSLLINQAVQNEFEPGKMKDKRYMVGVIKGILIVSVFCGTSSPVAILCIRLKMPIWLSSPVKTSLCLLTSDLITSCTPSCPHTLSEV